MTHKIIILVMLVIISVTVLTYVVDRNKRKKEEDKAENLKRKYNELDYALKSNNGCQTLSDNEMIRFVIGSQNNQYVVDVGSHERITLGKDPDNSVYINDDTISRHHALLYKRGSNLVVTDLGSMNGTFVDNGIRRVQIEPGKEFNISFNDTLYLGSTIINFSIMNYRR